MLSEFLLVHFHSDISVVEARSVAYITALLYYVTAIPPVTFATHSYIRHSYLLFSISFMLHIYSYILDFSTKYIYLKCVNVTLSQSLAGNKFRNEFMIDE